MDSDWPTWATEEVEVREYQESWSADGEVERQELERLLAPWLVARVEPGGATAIPSLAAKPILDFQAAVSDLSSAEHLAVVLEPHAWHYVPPETDGGRPWRRFFVKVATSRRVAHLHVMNLGSARWNEQIAFRDALCADRGLVDRYAKLKVDLAVQHRQDREAYSRGKAAFVYEVINSER